MLEPDDFKFQTRPPRFTVTQKVLKKDLVWVVVDRDGAVMAHGSYVSCSNACRELNQTGMLTQAKIDERPKTEKPMNAWQQLFWRVARREQQITH